MNGFVQDREAVGRARGTEGREKENSLTHGETRWWWMGGMGSLSAEGTMEVMTR